MCRNSVFNHGLVHRNIVTWLFILMVAFSLSPIDSAFIAQPAGVPEILKKSLHSCSVNGGSEVFIIGKNFLKGTKVVFQENASGIFTC